MSYEHSIWPSNGMQCPAAENPDTPTQSASLVQICMALATLGVQTTDVSRCVTAAQLLPAAPPPPLVPPPLLPLSPLVAAVPVEPGCSVEVLQAPPPEAMASVAANAPAYSGFLRELPANHSTLRMTVLSPKRRIDRPSPRRRTTRRPRRRSRGCRRTTAAGSSSRHRTGTGPGASGSSSRRNRRTPRRNRPTEHRPFPGNRCRPDNCPRGTRCRARGENTRHCPWQRARRRSGAAVVAERHVS